MSDETKNEKIETWSRFIGMMGSILAMIVSWSVNKSILWCILHGIFGWIYVIYYAIMY